MCYDVVLGRHTTNTSSDDNFPFRALITHPCALIASYFCQPCAQFDVRGVWHEGQLGYAPGAVARRLL